VTEPLYLEDSTVRTFEATVERVDGERLVLDRTHFYPTGGGQPHDTGVLHAGGRDLSVVDVRRHDVIHHVIEGEAPEPGTTVHGELDWERRRAHMRYHTAQHLLSALLLAEYDARTVGNQLYEDHARLDCRYPRFNERDLERIERRLNELISEDRQVRWYALDRERAERELDPERTRLDLLPESITQVRVVEIGTPRGSEPAGPGARRPEGEAYDRTACAGTHVSNTAEIGHATVTGRQTQGSDRERIEFVLEDE
jgi:misacylated tRNA(Ala) deacylase